MLIAEGRRWVAQSGGVCKSPDQAQSNSLFEGGELKNLRFAKYFLGYPIIVLGKVVQVSGVIIVVFLTASLMKGRLPFGASVFQTFIYYAVGTAAAFGGGQVVLFGKKIVAKKACELLLEDRRNPVLYLRSFLDDAKTSGVVETNPLALVQGTSRIATLVPGVPRDITLSTTTEEEILAHEFDKIGPCVAVGLPGEKLPKLGMARMYFENEKWESGVEELMASAELVLMRAGTTAGFLRELDMAVRVLNPQKLLLLLPSTQSTGQRGDSKGIYNYQVFREAANKILPQELPVFSVESVSWLSCSAVISFQSDWTPCLLRLFDVGSTFQECFDVISTRYSKYGTLLTTPAATQQIVGPKRGERVSQLY